ncbi:MAG: type II toxin-antitoxin system VapC family toxin [Alphaproteobacteria bacterium]|nr:type II toxin-antitoxin system VapC family toxin [Alphaproteobacteria bacterium]
MNYLLDTNILSEGAKPRPEPGVVAWLADLDEDRAFVSVVTMAELRQGIERLTPGARRDRLELWLRDELSARFEGRILPIDTAIADAWGRVMARARAAGRPVGAMDAGLAATAAAHGLVLVTRNTADFAVLGLDLLNPWYAAP